ncbi:hypothetical protein GGI15_001425 [Coemansia interrupta]|uniref:BZIP domain-containing protein n=1 Tax=Coemansia interrupta TaxID=1126814 RepID=A0A9W8HK05_9FUNG|nr:hypothetical protein GGI15_001425 [Coemansia interrupta]
MDNHTSYMSQSNQESAVSSSQSFLGYAVSSTPPQNSGSMMPAFLSEASAGASHISQTDGQHSTISSEADAGKEDSVQPSGDVDSSAGRRSINSSKRAAQNRAAQRAFRLRRERYVASLEDKARNYERLESAYIEVQRENQQLRTRLHKLHSENTALRTHLSSNTPMMHASTGMPPDSFTPIDNSPAPYYPDVAEVHPVMIGGSSVYPQQEISRRHSMHPDSGIPGEYDSIKGFYPSSHPYRDTMRKTSAHYAHQRPAGAPAGFVPPPNSYPQYQPHAHMHAHKSRYNQQHPLYHHHDGYGGGGGGSAGNQLQPRPMPAHLSGRMGHDLHHHHPSSSHSPPRRTMASTPMQASTGAAAAAAAITAAAAAMTRSATNASPGVSHDSFPMKIERDNLNPAAINATRFGNSLDRTSSPSCGWDSGPRPEVSISATSSIQYNKPPAGPETASPISSASATAMSTVSSSAPAAHVLPSVREITRSMGSMLPGSPHIGSDGEELGKAQPESKRRPW